MEQRALDHFRAMVESVGVKRFSAELDLSTRQVNRILSRAQPNPLYRLLLSLNACAPEVGDAVLDYMCQELGGYFVRAQVSLDHAAQSAVKECAEAIAAISDGDICPIDQQEVREAIAALHELLRIAQRERRAGASDNRAPRSAAPEVQFPKARPRLGAGEASSGGAGSGGAASGGASSGEAGSGGVGPTDARSQ
jgi:uncharacterized membrane protein YgcG